MSGSGIMSLPQVSSGRATSAQLHDQLLQPRPSREELDFISLGNKLWRRKYLIIATAALLTALATAVVFSLTPRYVAEALVVVGTREPLVGKVEVSRGESAALAPPDVETVQTEVEILRSPALAQLVIADLGLEKHPEFSPAKDRMERSGIAGAFRGKLEWVSASVVGPVLAAIGLEPEAAPEVGAGQLQVSPEDDLKRIRGDSAVDIFLAKLRVAPKNSSRVIAVDFESEDAQVAARVVNTLVDHYITDQLDARFAATQRASNWLSERVDALRRQVEGSEKTVEEYRAQHGLISDGSGTSFLMKQLAEVNEQLVTTDVARQNADARLRQLNALLTSPEGIYAASDVLNSPVIQALRRQEADLQRKRSELTVRLKDDHPQMVSIKAEIADTQAKIRSEAQKIASSWASEAKIGGAKMASLKDTIKRLRADIDQANQAEITLRALQREAKSNQMMFEAFLTRFKETSEQGDKSVQRADAQIVSHAHVPAAPTKPKRTMLILIAAVTSSLAGILLALGLEKADRSFRSSEEIESEIGSRVLSLVPLSSRSGRPHRGVLANPSSSYGEAIRAFYTGLVLATGDNTLPKVVVVTSARPQEGKTTLAISLAFMAASSRQRVLLIDADLRRARLGQALGLQDRRGLAELLAREVEFADVVVMNDSGSGADVIPAGRPDRTAAGLSALEEIGRVLNNVAPHYDLVIVDSPPVLAVADALVLSARADATVFAVRWGVTHREAAKLALKRIVSSGGSLAGIVLTMVDPRMHSRYGFSDSGCYGRDITHYHVG